MPTAVAALLGSGDYIVKGVHQIEWNATVSGRGNPLSAANMPDKTMTINGVTTAGGSSRIILEGTNDDPLSATTAWQTLTSPTDGDMDFTGLPTTGFVKAIRENPRYIRPFFQIVTTNSTLNVIIISR
jgi:hypothetical protein